MATLDQNALFVYYYESGLTKKGTRLMPNNDSSVIAIHACGFADEDHICGTFLSRIYKATDLLREIGPRNIMISGGVKYTRNSSHLLVYYGMLALQKILDANREIQIGCRLIGASECYNSSTDILNFLRIAKEQKSHKIIAVSSYWHHWALKPLYAYWIEKLRLGMAVKFISPDYDHAGIKTKCFYAVYGLLIRISMAIGLFPIFDRFINKLHSQRRINGYPVSGCD